MAKKIKQIKLTNQSKRKGDLDKAKTDLASDIEARKALFDKVPPNRLKKLIKSGKDPVLSSMYNMYLDLKNLFEVLP